MNILIANQQEDLLIDSNKVENVVLRFMEIENISADEVSINFVDTETIIELHNEYFDDPTTTDCISFPMDDEDEEYRVLGEIFVCPRTAINYVHQNGGDPTKETMLYVIHGLLHLIGLDDIDENDRQHMRKRELVHLQAFDLSEQSR